MNLMHNSNEVSDLSKSIEALIQTNERLEIESRVNLSKLKTDLITCIQDAIYMNRKSEAIFDRYIQNMFENATVNDTLTSPAPPAPLAEARRLASTVGEFTRAAKTTQDDLDLLKRLYFSSMYTRHRKIEAAHDATFRWVFQDVVPGPPRRRIKFREWLQTQNGVFWIKGKPGSGKSTLMKFLCSTGNTRHHLEKWAQGERLIIGKFFFWNAGTDLQKSHQGLLRSLIFEILRKCTGLIPLVRGLMTTTTIGGQEGLEDEADVFSSENLLRVYEAIVTQGVLPMKFCFFIDGLDEFQEERQTHTDLIKTLREMNHSPNIKLCVSSRPWTLFDDEFGGDSEWTLKLEDLTRGDIVGYVTDKFNEHSQFQTLSQLDANYSDLIYEVAARAQGVFLWVYLVVRNLLEGFTYHDSIVTIQRRLEQFPPDLEAFFQHLIDSVSSVYRAQLARTLQLAMHANKPMLAMFYSFLDDGDKDADFCSGLPHQELRPRDINVRLDQLRRRLDGRSKGLLEIVERHELTPAFRDGAPDDGASLKSPFFGYSVDFLHRTVRDFIHQSPEVQTYIRRALVNTDNIHLRACHASVAMMKAMPLYRNAMSRRYMCYLVEVLFYFVSRAADDRIPNTPLLKTLAVAEDVFNTICTQQQWPGSETHFIGLCAQVGYTPYILESIQHNKNWLTTLPESYQSRPLLDYALIPPPTSITVNPKMVELLLESGENPNHTHFGNSAWSRFVGALDWMLTDDNREAIYRVTEMLIMHGADMSAMAVGLHVPVPQVRQMSWFPDIPERYQLPPPPPLLRKKPVVEVLQSVFPAHAAALVQLSPRSIHWFTPPSSRIHEGNEQDHDALGSMQPLVSATEVDFVAPKNAPKPPIGAGHITMPPTPSPLSNYREENKFHTLKSLEYRGDGRPLTRTTKLARKMKKLPSRMARWLSS